MKLKNINKIMQLTAIASTLSALYTPVYAQAAEASQPKTLEVIEVTARKRAENLQEVPVAISALTADDVEKQGIIAISDLSNNSPGFEVSNVNSSKADRSNQIITIRGFTPSSAIDPTAAVFIDGVPVSSPSALQSIGSPARVEVLRGPQSAYFGRNTFAGAVNVVNKEPSEEWAGSVALTLGNYDHKRLRGDVEGVLVDDILSFRLSAEHSEREGAFENAANPGQTLGDQESTLANLYVVFKPIEELTFKLFGFMSKDEDGPTAAAFISGSDSAFSGLVVTDQSNCTVNAGSGICGSIPDKVDPISYNIMINDTQKELLSNSAYGLGLDDFGLVRELEHLHLVAEWDVSEVLTFSSLTGYNKDVWANFSDIAHIPASTPWHYFGERETKDFSQELRLTYVDDGPISGTFGVSYLETDIASHITNSTSFSLVTFTNEFSTEIAPIAKRGSETLGAFFGLNYEISDDLNLSLEGRVQKDKLYAFDTAGNEIEASHTNFLPRVILDYKIDENTMAYVTYSKGVNPGNFNASLSVVPQWVQDEAAKKGLTIEVAPEVVNNYEIGIKGSAFDGMMNYAASAYYAMWSDQLQRISEFLENPDVPGDRQSLTGLANTGDVNLYGLEFETNWMLTDSLRLNSALGYTGSHIKNHVNPLVTTLTGDIGDDFRGNEQSGVSKYSGNVGLQYDGVIADEYDYFTRVDVSYKSGKWTNTSNNLKTDAITLVNLRAGVYLGDVEVSAYVRNLFDNDSYTFAEENFNFVDFSRTSVLAALQQPRTVGIQVKWSFYE